MVKKKKPAGSNGASPKAPKGKVGVSLPIEHHFPESQKAQFSNYVAIQNDGHEFHFSFFEIRPPLLIGDAKSVQKTLSTIESVEANCVARIVISGSRIPSLLIALAEQFEKFKATQDDRKTQEIPDTSSSKSNG